MDYREIALVIVLAGTILLLTGATAGSRAAREARCQESLQAIYRMAANYSADNGGYIVPMLEMRYNRGIFWTDRLRDYAKDFQDFSCPANARHGALAFQENDLIRAPYDPRQVSFGINGHISGLDRRNAPIEKLENLAKPGYTVFFGDSNTRCLRALDRLWQQDYAPVHDGGMQAILADGHCERFTQETLGTFGAVPGWKIDKDRWKKWKVMPK